jgi:hypothetical protein
MKKKKLLYVYPEIWEIPISFEGTLCQSGFSTGEPAPIEPDPYEWGEG